MRTASLIKIVLATFTALHFALLPLVLSWDSQAYIDQALMLGQARFWSDWHFLRTPMFQSITRAAFILLGENRIALLSVTVAMGFLGLLVTQRILREWLSPALSWLITLFLSLNPLLITYQHTFLTESGSFMWLGLVMLAFIRCVKRGFDTSSCITAGLTIAAGYYFRPTILILSFIGTACFVVLHGVKPFSRVARVALLTLLLPQVLALPWKYMGSKSNWESAQVAFGVLNQVVIPQDSPLIESARDKYRLAIEQSKVNGSLTASGMGDEYIYPLLDTLSVQMKGGSATGFFLKVVRTYPIEYIRGFARGMLHLWGMPGLDSDNRMFMNAVFRNGGTVIFPGPPPFEEFIKRCFFAKGTPSHISPLIEALTPVFVWIYRVGSLFLILLFAIAIKRRDGMTLVVTIVPLVFIVYHAAVLFSLDRMAVPVTPYVIAVPLVLTARVTFFAINKLWSKQ